MSGPTDETIEAAFGMMLAQRAQEHWAVLHGRVHEWLSWRRDVLGQSGVDQGHSCSLDCRDHIQRIDPKLPLYGCNLSGRYHLCRLSAETCHFQYVDQGTHFCVYTGMRVGGQELTWRYCSKNKNTMCRKGASTAPMISGGGAGKRRRWNPSDTRKRRKRVPNKVEEAKIILDIILWDQGPRKRLRTAAQRRAKAEYGLLIKEYVGASVRRQSPINMHVLDRIVSESTGDAAPRPLVKELWRHQSYAEWIVKMWNIVTEEVPAESRDRFRVRFEQHAIGMLYRLGSTDIRKDGVVLLSRDAWLTRNLPPQSDLGHFRPKNGKQPFAKNDITKGSKHLVMALQLCDVPGEELAARF